ncbi:C2 domain-containing protein [Russula brevipes]|nr:C2 domain-containing protein [Russula brevipes]
MSKELGTLVIVVLKAQNLMDKNSFSKQDPYAKLILNGATKQTPVDPKGGQHPSWDAELRFPILRDPSKSNRTLTISVFSEKRVTGDELLGEGYVDITDTLKSGEFDDWVPLSLKGTQRGEVYLELTFFAAGPARPAPLTRRPSMFISPTEPLARPQQPVAQRSQRVVPSSGSSMAMCMTLSARSECT